MARFLLDTDAIIDFLLGIPASVALVQGLHEHGETLCVCDIVIAEVYAGLRPQHQAAAEKLLSSCTFLPTTPAIARQAGTWRYERARQGIQLSTTDTIVAATAHAHQASVVTGNVRDYPIREVSIVPLERGGK